MERTLDRNESHTPVL